MAKTNSDINNIFKELEFSNEELRLMEMKFVKVQIEKGEKILRVGDIVKDQYFILSGCLRTYYEDKTGKEHTIQFAIKDWWISDFTAFFNNTPSIMTIECLESAELFKISKEDMEELYTEIPKLETYFRKKMEGAFGSFQKRILSNLAQSAKERYLSFIKSYPNIEQKVKNYHIASYLGITTESLSRIRKEIVKR